MGIKISALTEQTTPNTADFLPVLSEGQTKKLSLANLFSNILITATAWLSRHNADGSHKTFLATDVSIVQSSKTGIADNDTLALVFDFVPSKIVLNWNIAGGNINDAGVWQGLTYGQSLVVITGTNTMTVNTNAAVGGMAKTTGRLETGPIVQNDTTNLINAYIGYDGGWAIVLGTATWNTSTKTLTITFQETISATAASFIEIMAIAFK